MIATVVRFKKSEEVYRDGERAEAVFNCARQLRHVLDRRAVTRLPTFQLAATPGAPAAGRPRTKTREGKRTGYNAPKRRRRASCSITKRQTYRQQSCAREVQKSNSLSFSWLTAGSPNRWRPTSRCLPIGRPAWPSRISKAIRIFCGHASRRKVACMPLLS
jgi:hypothetical protein